MISKANDRTTLKEIRNDMSNYKNSEIENLIWRNKAKNIVVQLGKIIVQKDKFRLLEEVNIY